MRGDGFNLQLYTQAGGCMGYMSTKLRNCDMGIIVAAKLAASILSCLKP